MSNKEELTLENWEDFDNGKESVWSAEWDGPEEPLEEEELQHEFLMMTYKGTEVFRWYYPQILECVEKASVEEFLSTQPISEVLTEDKEELLEFFRHWIWFVSMDNKHKPKMTFEAKEAIEEIGDDILEEMDSEYAKLGKQSELTKAIKRTLH